MEDVLGLVGKEVAERADHILGNLLGRKVLTSNNSTSSSCGKTKEASVCCFDRWQQVNHIFQHQDDIDLQAPLILWGSLPQSVCSIQKSIGSRAPDVDATEAALSELLELQRTKAYYWPGIFRDVAKYVQTCEVWQKSARKQARVKAALISMLVIRTLSARVAIDNVGLLPQSSRSGNSFIRVLCNYATNYPEAATLLSIESTSIVGHMQSNGHSVRTAIWSRVQFHFTVVWRSL